MVLKARHSSSGETVVLKLLHDPTPETRARFLREAETLASLRHPNLLRVTDLSQGPTGTPYMVMEFIRGRDLSDWVRTGGVPTHEVLVSTLASLADTLHYCHEEGLVHRDVKPKNVMIEEGSGRVVLVDFGLIKRDRLRAAWSTQDRQSLTLEGSTVGTPGYMPPEQVSVAHGEVDRRSDVYALGAVLYFLLTAEKPFKGVSPLNVIVKVLQADPPDPRSVNPDVSGALADLCQQCMAKDMAERPVSAQVFADALRASLHVPANDRRRRWGLMAFAVALAVFSAGALGVEVSRSESAPPETRAESGPTTGAEPAAGSEPSPEQLTSQAMAASEAGQVEEAAELLRQAAERGHVSAMYNLGKWLEKGQGVAKDESEAAQWFLRAAEEGDQWAMYDLGKKLEDGRGVPKDATAAAEWFRKAAKMGHEWAMYDLGVSLAEGRGVRKDEGQAEYWLSLAAKDEGVREYAEMELSKLRR